MSDLIMLYCAISFCFIFGVIIERELWKNATQIAASIFALIFSPIIMPIRLGSVHWRKNN